MQLRELREYAERRGWQIADVYTDTVAGSKDPRPALNRLMNDAKQRRIDAVLVWKLDRFRRSLRHLVNALAELEAFGVAFVSLRDNLDLSTPSGRLMFQIIGAMAEFERALIQERASKPACGMRELKASDWAARGYLSAKHELNLGAHQDPPGIRLRGSLVWVSVRRRAAERHAKNLCGATPEVGLGA